MSALVAILLFLHVLAAIVAFGPTFAFPIIGAAGGREPVHGNFAIRLNELIEMRLVLPLALTMPVTGLLMVWAANFDFFAAHWLDLAIVLYVIAITISVAIQRPIVEKMVHMTSRPPAMIPSEGPGAAPAGPPPEFLALVSRSQTYGKILTVLLLAIIFLMVVKPVF